jgi:hypothetical protein
MRLPVLGWGPMEPPIPVRGQGFAERHLGEDCVDQRSKDLLTRKGMITVSTPVFLLVLGEGHTEAWYQLSKEEQDDLWAKVQEVDRRAGAVVHIVCDSRWADESLLDWVVIEYPDFDAYRRKVAELEELNWYRYWSCKTILGTKVDINW